MGDERQEKAKRKCMGIEPVSVSDLQAKGLQHSPNPLGPFSGPLQDENGSFPPDLKAVISAWPGLSEADRQAVLAIVREATGRLLAVCQPE